MNFGQAKNEVAERMHDLSSTNLIRVAEWLNLAKDEMVAFSPHWPWLEATSSFNTVAGQTEYPVGEVGGDVEYILNLRIESDGPRVLLEFTPDYADLLQPDTDEQSGIPDRYAIHADQLIIYPTPSQAYTIQARYYRNVDDFLDDDDEPPWPRKWDYVWLLGAEYFGSHFNDDRRFEKAEQRFQVGLHKMLGGKDKSQPRIVMRSFSAGGSVRSGSPFPVNRFPVVH